MYNDKHLINWRENRRNIILFQRRVGSFLPHTSMSHYVDILTFLLHKSNKAQSLCLHTQLLSQLLMLKPIINQKWARPPTRWKVSGAKAWQSPTSFVLPVSRLDNHPGNVNIIILKTLSQVWMPSSSFLFSYFCVSIKEKSFYIINTKRTHMDHATWSAWALLDGIEFSPCDSARWGEYSLISRWQTVIGWFKPASGHFITHALCCPGWVLSGGRRGGRVDSWEAIDGWKHMRGEEMKRKKQRIEKKWKSTLRALQRFIFSQMICNNT